MKIWNIDIFEHSFFELWNIEIKIQNQKPILKVD